MTKLVFEEETYKVIGACIKVHKKIGNGFTVDVYHEALMKELSKAEIPFEQQKKLPIYYNGSTMVTFFVADFLCFNKIILEIKKVNRLEPSIKYQVISHLKSTKVEVALLINFGEKSLTWKRFINTHQS
ncbi:MAG: GxxExxY protein [Lutibacter sp.]|nr:MAG: GxxExxY protein [Lutibacter sp.]PHS52505.1 MAG: GxxExxY protein [Lutibacter sp.]